MSKGLEALEKVEDFEIQFGGYDETGEYKNYISLYQTSEYQDIKKELRALEIIKSKRVDTSMLLQGCSLPEYNEKYKSKRTRLLANEYELLREVLL